MSMVSTNTSVAPVRLLPARSTTELPPAVGPDGGVTLVTVGGSKKVNWSLGEFVFAQVPAGV